MVSPPKYLLADLVDFKSVLIGRGGGTCPWFIWRCHFPITVVTLLLKTKLGRTDVKILPVNCWRPGVWWVGLVVPWWCPMMRTSQGLTASVTYLHITGLVFSFLTASIPLPLPFPLPRPIMIGVGLSVDAILISSTKFLYLIGLETPETWKW